MSDAVAHLLARPIAHRGLHACGGAGPVENSIAAALAAVDAGYAIECDVQLARDGEAVVFHDETLERLTGASGYIGDRTSAELAAVQLRDGSAIPTLADFLAAVNGRVPVVVELKRPTHGDVKIADATLQCLHHYAGPVALESFDAAVLARCREASCPVGLVGPGADDHTFNPNALPRCDFLSWNIGRVAEAAARHASVPRSTWTVRSSGQWDEARACGAQIVFEGFRP